MNICSFTLKHCAADSQIIPTSFFKVILALAKLDVIAPRTSSGGSGGWNNYIVTLVKRGREGRAPVELCVHVRVYLCVSNSHTTFKVR